MRILTFLLFTIFANFASSQSCYNLSVYPTQCGLDVGSASVNEEAGGSITQTLWSNGATTNPVYNLAAGNYTVTITTSGCLNTYTESFIVEPSVGLGINAIISNTTCGNNNGSIICTDNDTFNNFEYSWSDGQTGKALYNLSPGVKTVTVCSLCGSGEGCLETHTFIVGSSSPISGNLTSLNTRCNEANGAATVIAVGGGEGHIYQWSNGESIAAITGLAPGTYTVTITSIDQCTPLILSTIVAPSTALSATLETTHTSCGLDNGRVSVMANHPNLAYFWNTGSSSANVDNLSAGTYTVTVTDGDGCQDEVSTEINNSFGFDLSIDNNENTLMSNQNGVSYQWIDCKNNTFIQGAIFQTFNPSKDGNYSVELKGIDINGNECVEITDCVNFVLSSSILESLFWDKIKMPTIIHDELSIQLGILSPDTKFYIKNMSGYSIIGVAKNVGSNVSIDTASLPTGMYFIVFENNAARYIKKVIKI